MHQTAAGLPLRTLSFNKSATTSLIKTRTGEPTCYHGPHELWNIASRQQNFIKFILKFDFYIQMKSRRLLLNDCLRICLSWSFVLTRSCVLTWVTKNLMQAISNVHAGRIWHACSMHPTPALKEPRPALWFFFFWASRCIHCLAALEFEAGVEQPFRCLIVQNRQTVQSMGRSMDWTLEDNMAGGLFFCATLTDRRGGHTPFVQAGVETFDTGAEAVKPDPGSFWEGHSRGVVPVLVMKMQSPVGLSVHSAFHW